MAGTALGAALGTKFTAPALVAVFALMAASRAWPVVPWRPICGGRASGVGSSWQAHGRSGRVGCRHRVGPRRPLGVLRLPTPDESRRGRHAGVERLRGCLVVPRTGASARRREPWNRTRGVFGRTGLRLAARQGAGLLPPRSGERAGLSLDFFLDFLSREDSVAAPAAEGLALGLVASGIPGGLDRLVDPVIVWFGLTFTRGLNIGHRHPAPHLPVSHPLAAQSALVPWLVCGLRWGASSCGTPQGRSSSTPTKIAYFNETVGGARNGWKVLVDSSLDWGQEP